MKLVTIEASIILFQKIDICNNIFYHIGMKENQKTTLLNWWALQSFLQGPFFGLI